MLDALTLVLTAQCNLRCEYCYENSKNKRRMEWPTLRAALDLALSHGHREVKVIFTGGEPLLEFPLIRRAVNYLSGRAPARLSPRLVLLTNGTLLDEKKLAFLELNKFEVQLSFDGVRKAQDLRGLGTFDALDELLAELRRRRPDFLRHRVKVSMTVTPRTVEHMADSVDYFLQKGVGRLTLSPSLADCSDWRPGRENELRRQFARISRASLGHYRRTGDIPLLMFRGGDNGHGRRRHQHAWVPGLTMSMCGAMRGQKLAVDVGGDVFACATLVRSSQRMRSPLLREAARCMRVGNLARRTDDDSWQHVGFSVGIRCPEIFLAKEDKYSSYRRCRDCRYFSLCMVCPVSMAHASRRQSTRRVPDFGCAFNFAAARQWEAFRKEVSSST